MPTQPLGPEGALPASVRAALADLRAADVAFGTLEAPLTDRGTPWDKPVVFRAQPRVAADVAAMGYDIVSLANNQTLNYGIDGLLQTMDLLEAHGIRYVGAGRTAHEAWAPVVVRREDVSIAFIGLTCVAPAGWSATDQKPGLAVVRVNRRLDRDERWEREEPGVAPVVRTWIEEPELDRARHAVAQARAEADMVFASVHWGVGSTALRMNYQEQLAAELIEAGVACVLGGHPPPLQGLAARDGALISFSQGTFVRQQPRPVELAKLYDAMPLGGCMLRLRVSPVGGLRATVIPTLLGERSLSGRASGPEGVAVLREIMQRSDLRGVPHALTDDALELEIRASLSALAWAPEEGLK